MKISNKKKVGTIPSKDLKGAMKIYRSAPGDLNAASYAAAFKAKQLKKDMVVIQGNSYGRMIYGIEPIDGSLQKYTVMKTKAKVVVATPSGDIFTAIAKPNNMEEGYDNMNLIEKYLGEAKPSQSTQMKCMECGHKFKKKLGKNTFEVKCPKCKGYDTEPM